MNDKTALQIIEDYFARKASQTDYEAALNYLATAPATRSRLVKLYKVLVEPGGISCETCQEEMLRYSDPVARSQMSATEREQFLLHVSQCVNCAEEYLELASFEQGLEQSPDVLEIPQFKVPQAAGKINNWPPLLKAKIERVVESARKLKLSLRFEPATLQGAASFVRETPAPYSAASSELILFSRASGENLPVGIVVTARRPSGQVEECEVQVTLQGQNSDKYIVMLRYDNLHHERLANEKGRATFEAIPVASLPDLHLEITTNR